MTKAELIAAIADLPDATPVYIESNGICRTTITIDADKDGIVFDFIKNGHGFEFEGVAYRTKRALHEAIAKRWLSRTGGRNREDMRAIMAATSDIALSCEAWLMLELDDVYGAKMDDLTEIFANIREDFDAYFMPD